MSERAPVNPYRISGPALISFSGGRTSAYMVHEILRAHGGAMPADIHVVFANTGKEREETLKFVARCGAAWRVQVCWIERTKEAPGFRHVGFTNASRNGEPFEQLITEKQRLPNWQERWCTQHLKVLPLFAFMRAETGLEPGQFAEVIGLRNDEGHRILRGLERAEKDGRRVLYPLARAKVTRADVMAFWQAHPFRLQLAQHEGNCDLCFMKGRGIRKRIIRDNPESAVWWRGQEDRTGGFFDRRDRVASLVDEVRCSPELFDVPDDVEFDAECGLTCGVAP